MVLTLCLNSAAAHSDTTIGSQLIGDSVNILSTGDATVRGSTVFGTNGVMIDSEKGNINIEAATNQYSQYNHILEKSSGLGGTGTGFSYGSRSNEQGKTSTATGHTGSTIASGSGDIDLSAHKGTLTVAGSEVNSLAGDIHGIAQNIAITDVQNTSSSDGFTKFKQTGVSVGVASPLLDLAQGLIAVADQAGKAKGGTQQGAVAASGALAAYNAYRAIDGINKFVPTSNVGGTAGAGLLSVGISVSLGTSKNESKTHTESTASQGSSLSADNISLTATGLGKADDSLEHNTGSDITVSNSSIKAKNNLSLKADDDVNLLAGKDTSAEKSTNKSSSASVGVTFGVGSSNGISFQAGFSVGKGKATGNGTSYANSHVEAGNLLSIESGDDTNLLGAQAKGQTVKAKVGGDLNIISLQDVNHYDSKQTNGGVSVSICVPPICVGTSSVSGNFSQEKMKSNYAGVAEQSGIIAGTGGFEIDVKGNTDLKGGAIVSAADASKNHLTTGTLTTSDIKNTSSYKASSMGISASYSPSGGGIGNTGISAGAPSFMNASDKDASITRAGISAGTVEITNQSAQTALTGQTSDQTIAELNRDTTPAEQLKDLWSEDKKAEIRNGFEIVKTLGQNTSTFMSIMASDIDAAKKAKDEIGNKILTLADGTPAIDQTTGQSVTIADLNDPRYEAFVAANPGVAQALGDYNNASAHYTTLDNIWGNGGYGSMILTGLVGAASGNVTGSGTALLQNTAINVVRQYGANEIKGIADGFMTDGTPNAESETIRGLLHSIAGCAGAAATGGDCASAAAGSAATVALNNLIGTDTTHMTAAQKQAYSNLIGTIVGGVTSAVGGDAGAAQLASKVEVENNFLYPTELKNMRAERRQCSAGTDKATEASCLSKVETKYTRISTKHNVEMIDECNTRPTGGACTSMKSSATTYLNDSYIKQLGWGWSSSVALGQANQALDQQNWARIEAAGKRYKERAKLERQLGINQPRTNPPTFFQSEVGTATLAIVAAPAAVVEVGLLAPLISEAAVLCTGLCATTATLLGPMMDVQSLATDDVPLGFGVGSRLTQAEVRAARAEATAVRIENNFYADSSSTNPFFERVEVLANRSTHNSSSDIVVLGKYVPNSSQSYEQVAKAQGATYFEMPGTSWDDAVNQLGADNMWSVNKQFLDNQIQQGKQFVFTVDPRKINDPKIFTYKEYDYLKSKGYSLTQYDGVYRAIKK